MGSVTLRTFAASIVRAIAERLADAYNRITEP